MTTSPYLGYFAADYEDNFVPNPNAPNGGVAYTVPFTFAGDGEVGARGISSPGVIVTGGTNTTISQQPNDGTTFSSYQAVEDKSTDDVLNGGNNNLTVYLDNNTTFNTNGG